MTTTAEKVARLKSLRVGFRADGIDVMEVISDLEMRLALIQLTADGVPQVNSSWLLRTTDLSREFTNG